MSDDKLEVDIYGELACDILTANSKYRSIQSSDDYDIDTGYSSPITKIAMDSSKVVEMIDNRLPRIDSFDAKCRELSVLTESFSEKLKSSNLLTEKNKAFASLAILPPRFWQNWKIIDLKSIKEKNTAYNLCKFTLTRRLSLISQRVNTESSIIFLDWMHLLETERKIQHMLGSKRKISGVDILGLSSDIIHDDATAESPFRVFLKIMKMNMPFVSSFDQFKRINRCMRGCLHGAPYDIRVITSKKMNIDTLGVIDRIYRKVRYIIYNELVTRRYRVTPYNFNDIVNYFIEQSGRKIPKNIIVMHRIIILWSLTDISHCKEFPYYRNTKSAHDFSNISFVREYEVGSVQPIHYGALTNKVDGDLSMEPDLGVNIINAGDDAPIATDPTAVEVETAIGKIKEDNEKKLDLDEMGKGTDVSKLKAKSKLPKQKTLPPPDIDADITDSDSAQATTINAAIENKRKHNLKQQEKQLAEQKKELEIQNKDLNKTQEDLSEVKSKVEVAEADTKRLEAETQKIKAAEEAAKAELIRRNLETAKQEQMIKQLQADREKAEADRIEEVKVKDEIKQAQITAANGKLDKIKEIQEQRAAEKEQNDAKYAEELKLKNEKIVELQKSVDGTEAFRAEFEKEKAIKAEEMRVLQEEKKEIAGKFSLLKAQQGIKEKELEESKKEREDAAEKLRLAQEEIVREKGEAQKEKDEAVKSVQAEHEKLMSSVKAQNEKMVQDMKDERQKDIEAATVAQGKDHENALAAAKAVRETEMAEMQRKMDEMQTSMQDQLGKMQAQLNISSISLDGQKIVSAQQENLLSEKIKEREKELLLLKTELGKNTISGDQLMSRISKDVDLNTLRDDHNRLLVEINKNLVSTALKKNEISAAEMGNNNSIKEIELMESKQKLLEDERKNEKDEERKKILDEQIAKISQDIVPLRVKKDVTSLENELGLLEEKGRQLINRMEDTKTKIREKESLPEPEDKSLTIDQVKDVVTKVIAEENVKNMEAESELTNRIEERMRTNIKPFMDQLSKLTPTEEEKTVNERIVDSIVAKIKEPKEDEEERITSKVSDAVTEKIVKEIKGKDGETTDAIINAIVPILTKSEDESFENRLARKIKDSLSEKEIPKNTASHIDRTPSFQKFNQPVQVDERPIVHSPPLNYTVPYAPTAFPFYQPQQPPVVLMQPPNIYTQSYPFTNYRV